MPQFIIISLIFSIKICDFVDDTGTSEMKSNMEDIETLSKQICHFSGLGQNFRLLELV